MSVLQVSVVIPTRGRPQLLARCLDALLRQDLPAAAYEIIVADNGPDATTAEAVRTAAELAGHRPCVHYLEAAAARGPAHARNRGWRAAVAPVIAFTDDDTVPELGWLREGLAALRPGMAAVAGRVEVPLPETPSDYERDAARLASAEFATANCFVRRDALAAIGGFDERFTAAWREDSDLQFRLLRWSGAPAALGRAPRAVVRHPVRPAPWGASLRAQRKVFFDALLYKKHPRLYRGHIRAQPRWDYYGIVALLIAAIAGALAGAPLAAAAAAAAWLAGSAAFCRRRLRGTRRGLREVSEVIATSFAIPPLATFWRLAGALRFRVVFL